MSTKIPKKFEVESADAIECKNGEIFTELENRIYRGYSYRPPNKRS